MRPIDADALMEQPVWLCGGWVGDSYAEGYMDALDKVEETVKSAPTIDAVLVVMCKDCKHCNTDWAMGKWYGSCKEWNTHSVMADWYCVNGERKDDE